VQVRSRTEDEAVNDRAEGHPQYRKSFDCVRTTAKENRRVFPQSP